MEKLFAIRNKRFQVKCLLFALYKAKTYYYFFTPYLPYFVRQIHTNL